MQKNNRKRKIYSLDYLLKKQPKSIREFSEYLYLVSLFYSSNQLKRIRISKKCFTLLNQAKISIGKLPYFYRYFQLPEHSFFPVFLKIKQEYLLKRDEKKNQKHKFINEKLKNLDKQVKYILRILCEYEKRMNKRNKFPVWNRLIYPKSKKRLLELLQYDTLQWTKLFLAFCDEMNKYYKCKDNITSLKSRIAIFFFNVEQEDYTPEKLKLSIRNLAKKYHPDLKGKTSDFYIYQAMKEIIVKKYFS